MQWGMNSKNDRVCKGKRDYMGEVRERVRCPPPIVTLSMCGRSDEMGESEGSESVHVDRTHGISALSCGKSVRAKRGGKAKERERVDDDRVGVGDRRSGRLIT